MYGAVRFSTPVGRSTRPLLFTLTAMVDWPPGADFRSVPALLNTGVGAPNRSMRDESGIKNTLPARLFHTALLAKVIELLMATVAVPALFTVLPSSRD